MSPKLWGLGFLEIAGGCSDKKCWFCPLHRQEPGARCRSALELPENLGVCSQNAFWIWSLLHFQLWLLCYSVSNCNWKQSLETYMLYYGNEDYANEQLIMSNAVLWVLFAFKEDECCCCAMCCYRVTEWLRLEAALEIKPSFEALSNLET